MDSELIAPKAQGEKSIAQYYGRLVFRQIFVQSDGREDEFFLFGSKHIPVIVFALTGKNEVIAVRQFRYGANCFVIETPGGNIKGEITEENIRETAIAELLEETGYRAETIISVGPPTWFDPASFRVTFFPVLALNCEKIAEPTPGRTEIIETVLIPLDKWIEMVRRGEICDSKTLAMTLFVLLYLKEV